MSLKKLDRIPGISRELVEQMRSKNILTAKDLLGLSILDAMETLDLSLAQLNNLRVRVSHAILPPQKTANDILKSRVLGPSFLTSGLATLDQALRGGYAFGVVTELVGPAGIGKTQYCLQAVLHAILPAAPLGPGLGAGCIYIDTEKKFSPQRIDEMCRRRYPEVYQQIGQQCGQGGFMSSPYGAKVSVVCPDSSDALLKVIGTLDGLVVEGKVKLVIIDSIASLLRAEFGGRDGAIRRAEMLGQQISLLKQLAERMQIVVLVTNQVTTIMIMGDDDATAGRGGARPSTSGPTLGAALGVKWAHAVNTRLQLESAGGERWVCIAKSPMAPAVRVPYVIEGGGAVPTPGRSTLPYLYGVTVGDLQAGGGQGGVIHQAIRHEFDYFGHGQNR